MKRSIVFWFGVYLYELLKNSEFKGYDLDVEYNRNFDDVKRTENFERTYPDIILHKRGSKNNNLLIIEFKTSWNNREENESRDIMKLRDFINPNGKYRYKHALFVILERDKASIKYIGGIDEYKNP